MRPIDFHHKAQEETGPLSRARSSGVHSRDIIILGAAGEYEILSYYISNGKQGGCMILDIKLKEST